MRLHWAQLPFMLLFAANSAVAQNDTDVNAAYQHAADGLSAFEAGLYSNSLNDFTRAYEFVKLPSLALYMARANAKLGHLLTAKGQYTIARQLPDGLGDPEVQRTARQSATEELESLQSRIPRLLVHTRGVAPDSLIVQIDGVVMPSSQAALGWPVDPGHHRVLAQMGNQVRQQQATIPEGETRAIVFDFQPPPAPITTVMAPPLAEKPVSGNNLRTAGWVSLGIGGAALAFSGTTAIWALVKHRDLEKQGQWNVNHCETAPSIGDCESYNKLRKLSTIGFYTGLVGAATGSTLLLLSLPHRRDPSVNTARVTPWVGIGYAGVQGVFR